MVVVAGFMRTGTSLLMQCLRENGFYIGEPEEINGKKSRCELAMFAKSNLELFKLNKHQHKTDFWYNNRCDVLDSNKNIGEHFIKFLDDRKINALKGYGLTMDYWLTFDSFRNAKFIRTKRCVDNIVESIISKDICKTKKEALVRYKNYTKFLDLVLDYKHIVVEFENMFTAQDVEEKRIAKFLGIDTFSTNCVDSNLWHFK